MGMAERQYPQGGGGRTFLANVTPVVKWLLVANVVLFLADVLSNRNPRGFGVLTRYGAYTVESAIFEGRIWEFVTFQFLHGHVMHLLFNCLALYFFGPWMERWWGSRKFLVFYLLSGAGGALFYTLLVFAGVLDSNGLVGASAGIYGILIGIAVIAPHIRVQLLFPPIELSMRQLAIGVLVIATGSILLRIGGNEGGEAGHLGGAIAGFLLVRFPKVLVWCGRRDPGVEIIRPKAFERKSESKLRPRSQVDLRQDSEIDLILDKISKDGFQSLTEEEREKLRQASKPNN